MRMHTYWSTSWSLPTTKQALCLTLLLSSMIEAKFHCINPDITYTQTRTRSPLHKQETLTPEQAVDQAYSRDLHIQLRTLTDAISFLYVEPHIMQIHTSIILHAPTHLHDLLKSSMKATLAAPGRTASNDIDIHELESYLIMQEKLTPHTMYIEPILHNIWTKQLEGDANMKVGLACSALVTEGRTQPIPSINIGALGILGSLDGVSLYCLDPVPDELPATPDNILINYTRRRLAHHPDELLGLLAQLDLIITTDVLMARCAQLVGTPVWFVTRPDYNQETFVLWPEKNRLFKAEPEKDELTILQILYNLLQEPALAEHKSIAAEVAIGELIDKITILQIKSERITDAEKLRNIRTELASLQRTLALYIAPSAELEQLQQELKTANEALWDTEDAIRDKEREKAFDDTFISLARAVYIQNDERCRIKRAINEHAGSRLVEEKSYASYA